MAESVEERLAALKQRVEDLAVDVEKLDARARMDHHLLRNIEASLLKITEAAKVTRQLTERTSRRLEVRLQWLALSVTVGTLTMAVVAAILGSR